MRGPGVEHLLGMECGLIILGYILFYLSYSLYGVFKCTYFSFFDLGFSSPLLFGDITW